jgi:monofunctional glycosyltransferase
LRVVRSLLLLLVVLLALPYALVLAYGQGHPISTLML